MKRDFNTVVFSPALNFFANKFVERWNLNLVLITLKTNVDKFKGSQDPLIIVGAHFHNKSNPACVIFKKLLDGHKGPQVFLLGGAGDTNKFTAEYVRERNTRIPTYMHSQDDKSMAFLESLGMGHKKLYIPMKRYDRYKPTKLGNKIWFHVGFSSANRVKERYGFDTVVKPIIEEFGKNRVRYINPDGPVRNEDFLHQRYNESFVYIKPNPDHGSTTMWELGRMGRRTICPGHSELQNVVTCETNLKDGKNIEHLISLIKQEEKRIGTIQLEVSDITKSYHIQNDRWLKLNFWDRWNEK